MRTSHLAVLTGVIVSPMALAQQAGQFEGTWSGSLQGGNMVLGIELVLKDGGGTWRMSRQGGRREGQASPCLGRDFPLAVLSRSASALVLRVEGSKVAPGCFNQKVTVKLTDNETLEGTLQDGRELKLVRR